MVAVAETTNERVVRKLHPGRFTGMSAKMAAIVGYILDQQYTDPQITDMCITSDDGLLAQHEGDCGMNDFMGSGSDLVSNWNRLLDCAGLTDGERAVADAQFKSRVKQW